MSDWSKNPKFIKFAKRVVRDTVPKLRDSTYFIAIAPEGGTADVKMAVEIGFAILLDKPLIVMVPPGRVVGEKLLRIADHVIQADMSTEEGAADAAEKLNRVMQQ